MNSETDALRGAEALALLRNRDVGVSPDGLFEKITSQVERVAAPRRDVRRFWLGTVTGAALAAAVFAMALTLGWFESQQGDVPDVAEFVIALNEPRNMDVAIEADRPLNGARLSVLLSGGIELDGYGHRRELSWTSDLEAGVNRLSLPIIAVRSGGGQMVVSLSHPDSEQLFVIKLKTIA